MQKAYINEDNLFKLIILVACIVVAMFFATILMGLVFLPNQVIAGMPSEDITFLVPMALATICSGTVLARYVQSYKSRSKG